MSRLRTKELRELSSQMYALRNSIRAEADTLTNGSLPLTDGASVDELARLYTEVYFFMTGLAEDLSTRAHHVTINNQHRVYRRKFTISIDRRLRETSSYAMTEHTKKSA
jgi:hypothetical protein